MLQVFLNLVTLPFHHPKKLNKFEIKYLSNSHLNSHLNSLSSLNKCL